ncbi:SNF2 family N-terminal domain-containing protein [Phaeosphaeria sp. MPI-PUGE-AT-0046c]|nr:SNF2 family N-terminal domain-containing protein [Phaeosphaeria sp. MPI-PUGE-AT-0046c]
MSDQDNMDEHGDNPHPHSPNDGANEVGTPVKEDNEDTYMSEHIESDHEDHDHQQTDAAHVPATHDLENIPALGTNFTPNESLQENTYESKDSQGRGLTQDIENFDDSDSKNAMVDDLGGYQEEIMQTVEQAPEFDLERLDPAADVFYEDEELQQQIDNEAPMTDTDMPPYFPGHVHNVEYQERDTSAEYMHGDQTLHVQSAQYGDSHAFQSDVVAHDVEKEDSSSLFVPEEWPAAPKLPSRRFAPLDMPSPARPALHPTTPGNSLFAKIRNMQKECADKKHAAAKRANARRHIPEPDNEAYLEAVMSPITPLPSTSVPGISGEELQAREALAIFERQKRKFADLKQKNGGNLTFMQDVEWIQIKGNEKKRRLKYARDMADEDAEGDADLVPEAYPRYGGDDVGDESDGAFTQSASSSLKRQRGEMPRKIPNQLSMREAEMQSMRVALEADEDMPKKKKKSQDAQDGTQMSRTSSKNKGTKGKSKNTKSKANAKTPTRGPRKTAKSKRDAAVALRQASSLLNANVFSAQAAEDAREVPTFRTRNKQDALKELIASVPLEEMKDARGDMSTLLKATKDFVGYGPVKADAAGGWLVKGMRTSLKNYQVLGSAFMRRRETAPDRPQGGLMADQMGLGKTLMMIANIVNGQPKPGIYPRTTLLVASPALLTQWAREIEQHQKPGFKIMRYGSGTRLDSNQVFDVLQQHDYILTTYSEVMKSYPKNEPPIECQTAEEKIAWWKETYDTQRGILHRMRFLRVVLDEAQAIKNHLSRTSIACRALMADHKWAMSGTPILNSLTELYPYFKFLNVPHTGSYKIFKHNYCDSKDAVNTERLLSRLAQFMIRRTHADRMFHAPILKLPQAAQGTFWCEFNPIERVIYEIVRDRFSQRINQWRSSGELERSYGNALVMLLRLRQLTAHVLMLQFVMRDLLELDDIERIKEVVREQSADSSTQPGRTIIAIRKQLEKHAIEGKKKAQAKLDAAAAKAKAKAAGKEWVELDDEAEVEDDSPEPEPEPESELDEEGFTGRTTAHEGARLGGSGKQFGKNFNFKPYLASLKTGESWEQAKKNAICSYCGRTPSNPWISSCGHLICNEPCMEQSNLDAAESAQSRSPCKACGQIPTNIQPCDPEDYDPVEPVARGTRSRTSKKKAKKQERHDREDIAEDWLAYAGAEVLPSAKTLAIKAQILNWRKEDPKVKIIIYTQFLAMVRILGKICQQEGWQAEQYIGTMSFNARDKAISTFADDPDCNILLASLRCGGLGLNLTMASRVIMLDPWWNEASEQQAFCRVFRIGQKDETFMSRLCVKNTIDQRLMDMHDRKNREINEVMDDDGSRVRKLSLPDLVRLFIDVDESDEDGRGGGKTFVMVDNPDPSGGFRADRDDEGYADEM